MQPAAWMTHPSLFLVTGLPWPEADGPDGQPVPLGRDLTLMLDAGSQCAAALGKTVLFVSDITRWLADTGRTWEHISVDFATAQNELERQSPALLVTVSRTAYTILCSAARNLTVHCTSGGVGELKTDEREKVRTALEARLDNDWPAYITKTLASVLPAT